ncbi:START domain-containing protein [Endozoicomonas sp. ONNA2]|uniref:START domain-containing protein n=1 Tax=Endozoicomonas sp. ONNA2 TaxID=2828741 RepID=UPI002148ADFB|nr:START domain-containing protein [Endozoicomonas sp. ONNA2]
MRASQDYPQFDGCSNGSVTLPESRRQNDCAVWLSNSVSAEENVVRSTAQEQTITSATKPLADRRISPGFQVSQCPNGKDAASPILVESKGQMYQLMQLPDFIKLRDFAESQDNNWTKVYEDRPKALLVESRPEDLKPGEQGTGFNIVRATVQWDDVKPETLFNTLHDADYRKTWDGKMIDGRNICQLDPRNDIGYYSLELGWLISNRDFCNMRSWMEFSNGDFIIMNRSVDHPDCPEREGFVRARSILTGYYLTPTPSGGAKLIFISHTDPKGSLPAWLINSFIGKVIPYTVNNLHDCALKYDTWAAENRGADAIPTWRTPKVDWSAST